MVSPSGSVWVTPTATPTDQQPVKVDSSIEKTVQSYASPLTRLADAAKSGNSDLVQSRGNQLTARSIRLTGIAESAATALGHDTELLKSEVKQLL